MLLSPSTDALQASHLALFASKAHGLLVIFSENFRGRGVADVGANI